MEASPPRLRLFVAVSLPVEVRAWVTGVIEILRDSYPGARWVDPINIHITLRFIGWIDEAKLPVAKEITKAVAATHQPAEIGPSGLGAFPRPSRARVIWLGLYDPAALLESAARDLDASFESLGVAAENRAFTPHLTLARLKTPARVDLDVELPRVPAPFLVEQIDLYRSHMSPNGARYEKLASEYLGTS